MTQQRTTPTVLVVENSAGSGPGRLLDFLADAGVRTQVVRVHAGEPLPAAAEVDGIVLLGGGLLPDQDHDHPFLPAERALAREAIDHGVPLLGICLGMQLLAHVTEGVVTAKSGETERGSTAIRLLPAAAEDPLFGSLGSRLQMVQNHQDSVTTAPPSAVVLADSDSCTVQAFRIGESAWGVQFHPEVGAERLLRWDESAMSPAGLNREQMYAEALAHEEANQRQSRALIGAFAARVREHAEHGGSR